MLERFGNIGKREIENVVVSGRKGADGTSALFWATVTKTQKKIRDGRSWR